MWEEAGKEWRPYAVIGVTWLVLSAGLAGASPVAVGYGTDPVIAVADDGSGIMVAFSPTIATLPDGSDAPALRPVSITGVVGPALPIPGAADPFTGPFAGPSWVSGGMESPGAFWTANTRRSRIDHGAYAIVIGRYGGMGALQTDPVWQWALDGKFTPWRPRVAVQRGTGGDILFVTYDTHGGDPTATNYGASYVHRVLNGVSSKQILVTDRAGTSFFKGSWLQPIAGTGVGQAFLMGLATRRDAPFEALLYFHELIADTEVVDSAKQPIGGLSQPGQLFPHRNAYELNGHWDGEKADMSIDRRSGRLWVAYAANPNPSDAARDQGDIHVVRSDDRAATWQAGGPANGTVLPLADQKTQFFPAIDVDGAGWVHVAYLQNEIGMTAGGVLHASQAHAYYTVSRDGGANWLPPVRISDEGTGLRFEDPPRLGTEISIGTRLQVKGAQAGAGESVAHVCWTSYDVSRRRDERALVVCSSITRPFCGNRTVDPGEACDDGNTVDGDCCSSACRAETGMPCEDSDRLCTSGDTCGGDGTCSSGRLLSIEDVNPTIGGEMNGGACEGVRLPRRFVQLWEETQRLLDRARSGSGEKALKHGAQAYCRYDAALMAFRKRKPRRLESGCRAHVKETLREVGKQLHCLHSKKYANC